MDTNSDLSSMDLDKNIVHDIKNDKEFKEGGVIYLNADFPRKDKGIVNAALKTGKYIIHALPADHANQGSEYFNHIESR